MARIDFLIDEARRPRPQEFWQRIRGMEVFCVVEVARTAGGRISILRQ